MSIVPIEDFKSYLKVTRGADMADDDLIQAALDAATEGINEWTHRQFVTPGAATVRSFEQTYSSFLRIHDCSTVTAVTADAAAVSLTLVQTRPVSRVSWSGNWQPIEEIYWPGRHWASTVPTGVVSVTATWGWATIPTRVVEACKILTKDVLANRDVSFGIAAFTEYAGVRARENPQVAQLLDPLRRVEAFGIA